MRNLLTPLFAVAVLASTLSGCGGSGGGSTTSSSPISTESCGAAMATHLAADNVLPVTVTSCGIVSTANMLYSNVTICAPGTADCKTVGYVLVDTGSYGLRIFASALGSSLTLPAETDGSRALIECEKFVSGYMWGNVRLADVKLGGLTASSVPVQIVGDSGAPAVPADCSGTGASMNSVSLIGANGILGIGPFGLDGGDYYTCTGTTGSSCTRVSSLPSIKRVTNPVTRLASDNNGVILDMPAVSSSSGDSSVTGSLILGIGTQANNVLGSATVLDIDNFAEVQTTYTVASTTSTIKAFIDSGSNGLFFNDTTVGLCTSVWYRPAMTQSRSATLLGATNGHSVAVSFDIANATTLFSTTNTAFDNLGGPWDCTTSKFDWGMSFFYGRRVYYGIEGNTISGNAGPFVAF